MRVAINRKSLLTSDNTLDILQGKTSLGRPRAGIPELPTDEAQCRVSGRMRR